jgi:hypothetical protein
MPTDSDSRFEYVAKRLIERACDHRPLAPVLRQQCPAVMRQLVADRRQRGLLDLWGQSQNFDEHSHEVIVHPAILRLIGELAGVPLRESIVHAGLEHTYGYLFSLIKTPFGNKRDRWIESTLDEGFGLSRPTLRATPYRGTLLGNVTYFLGRIAFRDNRRELAILEQHRRRVAPPLLRVPWDAIRLRRIIETANVRRAAGKRHRVTIHTDLVPFLHRTRNRHGDRQLLIYSVIAADAARPKLITAFTIQQEVVESLTDPATMGNTSRLNPSGPI